MTRALVALLLVAAVPAAAAPWRLEVGPLAGAVSLDPALADYRWDTAPRFEGGLTAGVARGRWALGLRVLRAGTTQGTGLGDAYADPAVRLTRSELQLRGRVARPLGVAVAGLLQAGWLHVGYAPDGLSVPTGPSTPPVDVRFAAIDEPVLGGGLELRRALGRGWTLAAGAEASTFALDTTHRRGDAIVDARRRFWNLGARLALTWSRDLGAHRKDGS